MSTGLPPVAPDIAGRFTALIQSPNTSEQILQTFLEEHSELLPIPFQRGYGLQINAVISKFRLSPSLVSDFVFITGDSAGTDFTFIEIERANKPIFQKEHPYNAFHSEFNNAMAQVEEWKDYIKKNAATIENHLSPLITYHGDDEPVSFKYLLIYGTKEEFKHDRRKVIRFNELRNDSRDFKVMAYDSLISWNQNNAYPRRNVIVAAGQKFQFKRLTEFPFRDIIACGPAAFQLTGPQEQRLQLCGFDVDSWKQGKKLDGKGQVANWKPGELRFQTPGGDPEQKAKWAETEKQFPQT